MKKHGIAEIAESSRPGEPCPVMKTKTTSVKAKLNSAFSLVELLVVIAVIAVIAAIAIPNITGTREAAVNARDAANNNERTRFLANIQAMGNTNAVLADITNNFVWTNTNTTPNVVFKYTDGTGN